MPSSGTFSHEVFICASKGVCIIFDFAAFAGSMSGSGKATLIIFEGRLSFLSAHTLPGQETISAINDITNTLKRVGILKR